VDADSTNGTFVNGERVDAPQRLASGDIVRLGETELEVKL
jgi:pSer/pThr/pTyr-binding forkhead associated (FHA) protein